jgi:hypothetical protein
MNYIKIFLLSAVLLVSSCSLFQRGGTDENKKEKIYVASVYKGRGADSIPTTKFHQAMNYAAMLSGKYELIPPAYVDSVFTAFELKGKKPTAIEIGRKVDSDKILFASLSRLHNMLRVDLQIFNTDDEEKTSTGKGYELMNFYDLKSNEMLIDPSLLKATQRAFADVTGDSLMFDSKTGSYRVYPATSLVISGIAYVGMPDTTDWQLYRNRVISSYDAAETIFEVMRDKPNYITYDIPTRDSIYAMFNMFGIENYMPPTNIEVEALRKLEVDYFISGKISFKKDSAILNLMLFKITPSGQNMVKTVSGTLSEDNTEEFRELLRRKVNELIE